ncbi:hypothetical protein GPALN_006312 [Globodera pallida]|nr:hypothetical protein GPALN_006312 [Globodera pallida]
MMRPSMGNHSSVPSDMLTVRQQRAQELAEEIARDCVQLEQCCVAHGTDFDSEIHRVTSAWTDAMRSRSNKKEKLQLLADARARLKDVFNDTQKVEAEIKHLVDNNAILDRLYGNLQDLKNTEMAGRRGGA